MRSLPVSSASVKAGFPPASSRGELTVSLLGQRGRTVRTDPFPSNSLVISASTTSGFVHSVRGVISVRVVIDRLGFPTRGVIRRGKTTHALFSVTRGSTSVSIV